VSVAPGGPPDRVRRVGHLGVGPGKADGSLPPDPRTFLPASREVTVAITRNAARSQPPGGTQQGEALRPGESTAMGTATAERETNQEPPGSP